MPAPTLHGRLICAASCAYMTRAGEPTLDPDTADPYYAGVGYLAPPAACTDGLHDIDSCLVGTTADGVVVAFRGTIPPGQPFTVPMLLDWVNNLNARPVP